MKVSQGLPGQSQSEASQRSPPVSLAEKMARGDVMAAACPSRAILQHLTSRWGVLVLLALLPGTRRFSELRRTIDGVSERMLSQTLRWLEEDGMVSRTSYNTVPPRVEYSLTVLGREAAARVHELTDWIEANLGDILAKDGHAGG